MPGHPTELSVVRMTDDELLAETYEAISTVAEHLLSDRLYWLVTEAVERWAPDVERRYEIVHHYTHNREHVEDELEAWEESFERRAALRARFRDVYGGLGDDA